MLIRIAHIRDARMKYFLPAVVLFFFAVSAAHAADSERTLDYGGRTRHYLVHLPPQASARNRLPVVLVFHGGGGNAQGAARDTGVDAAADRYGFIAVYPAGTGPKENRLLTWNAGQCCGWAAKNHVDDVGFVSTLIDALAKDYPADTARVYATGISNGAHMTYRLACELSGKIAAIAPVAGQSELKDCHPQRPVAVLHIHGTADPCTLYQGGQCGGCVSDFLEDFGIRIARSTWTCEPVETDVMRMVAINHCSQQSTAGFQKGAVTCESFQGCAPGGEVTLCRVQGGGHSWPGGKDPAFCERRPGGYACRKWKETVGPTNMDIDASDFILQFFARQRRP